MVKRTFEFKRGQSFNGYNDLFLEVEKLLSEHLTGHPLKLPTFKRAIKVSVTVEAIK